MTFRSARGDTLIKRKNFAHKYGKLRELETVLQLKQSILQFISVWKGMRVVKKATNGVVETLRMSKKRLVTERVQNDWITKLSFEKFMAGYVRIRIRIPSLS